MSVCVDFVDRFATFQTIVLESILQLIMGIIVFIFVSNFTDRSKETDEKQFLISHIFGVILVVFFMAFVVAAGVEETMKHFVVRCCQFPSVLKDPHTVLVYLLSAALGFATAENIEYVFSSGSSGIYLSFYIL
jgi:RsiW-degrading membrane proteinase PrsW (M82 family)